MLPHTKYEKNPSTYACHILFMLNLRKIKFDSVSSNMLAQLGVNISEPWLKTHAIRTLDAGIDNIQ